MSTIIITGCSSGLGLALSIELSKNKDNKLVLIDANEKQLEKAKILCKENNDNILAFSLRVNNEIELQTVMTQVLEEFSFPDILINLAGLCLGLPTLDCLNDEVNALFTNNYITCVTMIYQFNRIRKDCNKKGQIFLFSNSNLNIKDIDFTHYYAIEEAKKSYAKNLKVKNCEVLLIELPTYLTPGVRETLIYSGKTLDALESNLFVKDVIDLVLKRIN